MRRVLVVLILWYAGIMSPTSLAAVTTSPSTPATVTSREERVATLIADVMNQALLDCTPIAMTSAQTKDGVADGAVPYDQILLSLLLQRAVEPWMLYRLEDWPSLSVPSPATLQPPQQGSKGQLCIAYVLIMDLQDAAEAFRTVSRSDWYPGAERYFLWYGGAATTPEEIYEDPILHEAYNTLYISEKPDSDTFYLYSNCPFCESGLPEVVLRNHWSPDVGLHNTETQLFPDLFKDCNGHVLRSVTLEFAPFVKYTKPDKNSTGPNIPQDSVDVRIINTICETYNLTYELYEPEDGKWGYQLPNGSWTGVIGTVERYEADISMDVLITAQRDEYVDFTAGFHPEPLTFITSKPMPMPQWLSVIRPFQGEVWASLFIMLVSSGLVFWVFLTGSQAIIKLQQNTQENKTDTLRKNEENRIQQGFASLLTGEHKRNVSLVKAYFIMIGCFLAQSQRWPRLPAGQAFSAFWILCSLVITISYVSTLIAFLTVPTLSPTLETLEQLVKSDFSWGIADYGAADYQLFKSSKVPLYQEVFKGLEFCPSLVECIKLTQKKQFAYISWRSYMRDAIALEMTDINGEANIHMARQNFFSGEYGFALQKGSPFKRPMDRIIRRLLEGGFVPYWLTQFIENARNQGQKTAIKREGEEGAEKSTVTEQVEKLSIHHMQGVFYVYVLMSLFSSIVFCAEVLIVKMTDKQR